MRAVRIHGKDDLRIEEVPTPVAGSGQVLVKIAHSGICGSDLHYYYQGANGAFVVREPLIPGHEISGTVAEDPSGTYEVGQKVTIHPARFGTPSEKYGRHLWPNGSYLGSASTWPHTQGGMSEYLLVEDFMVVPVPQTMELTTAALAEPMAVGMHGIRIGGGVEGRKVLVSGSGPIGLLAAASAKALGAAEVWASDVLDGPLTRAKALGVDRVIRTDEETLPVNYFDTVLECTGIPAAINAAFDAIERGGIFVQIGMMPADPQPIALATIIAKEVQLRPTFRFDDEIEDAVELLSRHPQIGDVVLTHVFDANDAADAFAMAKNSEASGKVLVAM